MLVLGISGLGREERIPEMSSPTMAIQPLSFLLQSLDAVAMPSARKQRTIPDHVKLAFEAGKSSKAVSKEAGGSPPPRHTSRSGIPVDANRLEAPVKEGERPGEPVLTGTLWTVSSLLRTPESRGFFFMNELISEEVSLWITPSRLGFNFKNTFFLFNLYSFYLILLRMLLTFILMASIVSLQSILNTFPCAS